MNDTIMPEFDHKALNIDRTDKTENNLSPALIKSINKIIQDEGYLRHSIYSRSISTGGGNYMSLLMEIDIKGKTVDGKKETNLFVKQSLPESDKNLVLPQELFSRETFVYNELANVFVELQDQFKVPEAEKYNVTRCFNNENTDSLILENMVRQGFITYNRLNVMPLKALQLSLTYIAKFHALSIVIEKYKPKYYRNKIQTVKHPLVLNENVKDVCKSLYNTSIDILNDDRKLKVKDKVEELINKYATYLHSNESKMKCLCHGDYRMNNILIKEVGGKATEVMPVDFQVVYYGSPVLDLIYIIFSSTDQEMRKNELENFKEIYYASLKKFLQYFSIDVEAVYPQTEFENDFRKQLDFGLTLAFLLLPLILVAEDDVPELNSDLIEMKLHESFKPRVQEVVDDFIQWGYL